MGTSCTQLHMFFVANKSRESETSAYYNLYAFVCHFIFQSATNNTVSSNISIFSIGHIVLYCSSEYCNIAIFRYIVSPLLSSILSILYMYYCSALARRDSYIHLTDRHTNRQTDRQTDRHTHTHTQRREAYLRVGQSEVEIICCSFEFFYQCQLFSGYSVAMVTGLNRRCFLMKLRVVNV